MLASLSLFSIINFYIFFLTLYFHATFQSSNQLFFGSGKGNAYKLLRICSGLTVDNLPRLASLYYGFSSCQVLGKARLARPVAKMAPRVAPSLLTGVFFLEHSSTEMAMWI